MFYVQYLVTNSDKGTFSIKTSIVSRSTQQLAWVAVVHSFAGSGCSLIRMVVSEATQAQTASRKMHFIK